MIHVIAPLLSLAVAAALTGFLLRSSAPKFLRVMDVPNVRSLHDRPKPRLGGLGILLGIVVGVAAWAIGDTLPVRELGWIGGGALVIAGVSFLDDKLSVPPLPRLVMHFVAAGLLLSADFRVLAVRLPGLTWTWPLVVGLGFSLLYVVWMINLYNFMDGMDGFSGGMALFGFGSCAVVGWVTGHADFAMCNLVISAGAAGFLLFNFPPARIFMGDVGASTLGFLAAAVTLWAERDSIFPLWIGLLIFSPFVVDATVTLIRRLAKREKIWQAHRTHFYQRLVQLGWGHKKTVLWEYALMLGCGISATWAVRGSILEQQLLICAWSAGYIAIMLGVTWLERRT